MTLEIRHVAAKRIVRLANFVGWLCIISIILLPFGLMIILQGHMALALFETEENTRAQLQIIQNEYVKVKNIG